jgi:uncharacterized membrane protein
MALSRRAAMRRRLAPALATLGFSTTLGCGDPVDPCEAAPTYTGQVAALLEARCLGCHASTLSGEARQGAPEGLDLDDLARLEPHLEQVADAITAGWMPPSDGAPLTTREERSLVAAWRACGYPR